MFRLIKNNIVLFYFIVILVSIFLTHFILTEKDPQHMHTTDIMIESLYMTLILLPVLYLLIWVDIKKRIKVEKELREAIATKDKFFSIIAHDLRSPFQGFIGLTEMMCESSSILTKEELSAISEEMRKSAGSLFGLLENLLEWANMQGSRIIYSPKDYPLSEIVKHAIDILHQNAVQKEITVINSVPDSISIFVDKLMISSVLRNLLSNAIKFTNRGGKVIVSAKEMNDKFVELSVSDSGIGMSAALLNKLFKMEENVGRKGTEGESSTGLGLLICRKIVEMNSGTIRVESKENDGSDFKVTLPVLKKK